MIRIEACALPNDSLLRVYSGGNGHTDCYTAVIPGVVTHADFVAAFYTTWLFKLERLMLRLLVAKPSTDVDAIRLAAGTSDTFAAWSVEARARDQLLVTDFRGSTRSWLMVAALNTPVGAVTQLYFGSAVVPRRRTESGASTLGWGFRLLLGFHKLYSHALLRAACQRVLAARGSLTARG